MEKAVDQHAVAQVRWLFTSVHYFASKGIAEQQSWPVACTQVKPIEAKLKSDHSERLWCQQPTWINPRVQQCSSEMPQAPDRSRLSTVLFCSGWLICISPGTKTHERRSTTGSKFRGDDNLHVGKVNSVRDQPLHSSPRPSSAIWCPVKASTRKILAAL